jgi:hypothetical protein
MQDQQVREADGCLLVYRVSHRTSFDEVPVLHDKLLRTRDATRFPVVLVGVVDVEDERQVAQAEGSKLAGEWGAGYFETPKKMVTLNNPAAAVAELVRSIRVCERARSAAPRAKPGQGCAIL